MSLNFRLKQLRSRWKLTQKEMATKLKIAVSTYQYYERGERDVPSNVLIRICTFGVSPAWILHGKNEMLYKDWSIGELKILDRKLLGEVIEGVDLWLLERDITIDLHYKAELISLLYEQLASNNDSKYDSGTLERFMHLGTTKK